MKIELACDHTEGEAFVVFLNSRGHDATTGKTSHNFIDGFDMFFHDDETDELAVALSDLWAEYCKS